MLTPQMKRQIVEYAIQYSKGLIEDIQEVGDAVVKGTVTIDEIEDFVDEVREKVLHEMPEAT